MAAQARRSKTLSCVLTEQRREFLQFRGRAACSGLLSPVMVGQGEPGIDPASLVVPLAGQLVATGDRWEPYRLVDVHGEAVGAAGAYFFHLQAAGRAEATVRSYGMDLLRWFRFLWAAGVAWDRAARCDARDFCRWLQLAGKPARPHWRNAARPQPAAVRGGVYAPSVRAHSETVLRSFL